MSLFYSAGLGGGAIPDSIVDRPDDTSSFGEDRKFGMVVESDDDWPEIDAELSANTSGATRGYLYQRSDDTLLADTDISGLSGGDAFTLSAPLSANTEYLIVIDAEGSSYTSGFNTNANSYPYSSSDGRLRFTARVNGGLSGAVDTGGALAIARAGNIL